MNARGPYDMERLADDAQSVIATLRYTDYILVGHSMGGKVAQALAARPRVWPVLCWLRLHPPRRSVPPDNCRL